MSNTPSPNGSSGRQSGGQFGPGNRFGRGNPHARRIHAMQAIIRDETSDDDLRAVWRRLLEMAKAGDLTAAKLVFDRVLGKVRDVEPEPPEPGDSQPPAVIIHDWRLAPDEFARFREWEAEQAGARRTLGELPPAI
jgi:uncharacterized protein (DUF1800 family)